MLENPIELTTFTLFGSSFSQITHDDTNPLSPFLSRIWDTFLPGRESLGDELS
jgi:hypothetical protein